MTITLASLNEWKRLNIPHDDLIQEALKKVYLATTISLRFDSLYLLFSECKNYLNLYPEKNFIFALVDNLKKDAFQFARTIVNAFDEQELTLKIAIRNQYKKIDSNYMPWHHPPTRTSLFNTSSRHDYVKKTFFQATQILMQKRYSSVNAEDMSSDKKYHIRYLTETQREEYRIFPSDNKLKSIKLTGRITNEQNLHLNDFNTYSHVAHGYPGRAIFVISLQGDIYAGSTIRHQFYHSSFLAGAYTFFAGTMAVTQGKIQHIEDYSGHYTPKPLHNIQALLFFRQCGLLSPQLEYNMWNDHECKAVPHKIRFFYPNKPEFDPQLTTQIRETIIKLEMAANKYINSKKLLEIKKRNFLLHLAEKLEPLKKDPLITPKNITKKIEDIVTEEAYHFDMKDILSGGSWPRSQKTKDALVKLLEPKGLEKLNGILQKIDKKSAETKLRISL